MVSTRNLRFTFSVGEKVLCYEPDPTKARVLYDSKVLKVIVKTDKRGRKTVEYLIHFQGWNSSWDRYVSEDYILKHTDENWRLQRKLAERAHLRPGAYLYRRDRKDQKLIKLPHNTDEKDIQQGTSASSAPRNGSISNYSNSSIETDSNRDSEKCTADKHDIVEESVMEELYTHHQSDKNTECCDYSEENHNDKDNGVSDNVEGRVFDENCRSNGHEFEDICNQANKDDEGEVGKNGQASEHETNVANQSEEEDAVEHLEPNNFTCEITDVMKEILELDNELVKGRNKVVRLPAKPNVVAILESYVKEYAVNQICGTPEKSRRKYRRHQNQQIGPSDMDHLNRSLNICKEVADGVRIYFDFVLSGLLLYNEEREQYEQSRHMTVTKEPHLRFCAAPVTKQEEKTKFHPQGGPSCEQSVCQDVITTFDTRMGTPNVKKYARSHHAINSEGKEPTLAYTLTCGNSKETENPNLMSADSASNRASLPCVIPKEETVSAFHDNVSSITGVNSKHVPQGVTSNRSSAEGLSPVASHHTSLSSVLPRLLDWQLVPESLYMERPVMPSLVYGAVHLARLLVVLPSLLLNTDIPAKKHKLVLRHLQMILRYLEQNKDWFAENVYEDNSSLQK